MFMVLLSWPWSLREFTQFIWWMQTERRVAANPQTKPTDLGCESADKSLYPLFKNEKQKSALRTTCPTKISWNS